MSDMTKPPVSEQLEHFEQACRSRGLRVTQQRLEVFRELTRMEEHPSVEDIFMRVRRRLRTISLDTVYRTLGTFEEYGLAYRVQGVDSKARFDTNFSRHHHLVCEKCQKIEDFFWPDFDQMSPPGETRQWGKVDTRHAVLRGICSDCQKKNK